MFDSVLTAIGSVISVFVHTISLLVPDWSAHLEGFDEGPQQCSDTLPPAEQLDQSHDSEQPEEGD